MCTKNGSYCENEKREKKSQGEGGQGSQVGGQGGCERRSEAFVKIQKINSFFFFFLGGWGCRGGDVRLGAEKWSFCEK